ncbi:DUF3139 domain-containing protein [Paenibacillus nicotianae]|uniref:DUF3139 domain-containing protein n=1 Tax=Paenibacillus nicotianae TaxID=1526551 RepID=A0ABW4USP5_9BACL
MKKFTFLIIVLIVIVTGGYLIISYFKSTQTKDIEAYLQEKGYIASDIVSIKTEIAKAPLFNTKVIFKDEEKVIYYYWKVKDKIFQGTPEVIGFNIYEQDSYPYKHKEK